MPAERIMNAVRLVRETVPGLRRMDPAKTAGADHHKDVRETMSRKLGIDKETAYRESRRPSIGPANRLF